MAFEDAQFINFTNGSGEPINDANLNLLQRWALLNAHPIGSYYWSSENTNPSRLFGGTWEQVKDKFILAVGDEYTTVGATGGTAKNTLAESNLPRIAGSFKLGSFVATTINSSSGFVNTSGCFSRSTTSESDRGLVSGSNTGSLANNTINMAFGSANPTALNNNPPYETAYCWKRTA